MTPSTLKVRSGAVGVDGQHDAEHVKGVLGLVVGLDGQQVAEHDECYKRFGPTCDQYVDSPRRP